MLYFLFSNIIILVFVIFMVSLMFVLRSVGVLFVLFLVMVTILLNVVRKYFMSVCLLSGDDRVSIFNM